MRKQPDAVRYDRQTIFGLVRERPIDIHKDPVALNKYITEYLTTKGVFEDDEGTNQGTAGTLRHQYQKLMQWKRQCRTTKKPNAKWKTNHL